MIGSFVVAFICTVSIAAALLLHRYQRVKRETAAAIVTFLLVSFGLSILIGAAEAATGDTKEGAVAQFVPQIRQLQETLNIIGRHTVRIEQNTNTIIKILNDKQKSQPSAISQHIAGMWGESNCSTVSFRFVKAQNALVIESVNQPSGTPPYRFVGTIISEQDTSMEVRGEEPATAKGLSATFRYEGNGVTEHLQWQDRISGGTDVELNRCAQ